MKVTNKIILDFLKYIDTVISTHINNLATNPFYEHENFLSLNDEIDRFIKILNDPNYSNLKNDLEKTKFKQLKFGKKDKVGAAVYELFIRLITLRKTKYAQKYYFKKQFKHNKKELLKAKRKIKAIIDNRNF
jgi:hypothetical protein